ncbi:MAG: RidA family protein [Sphingobacteriaceae bacterium]
MKKIIHTSNAPEPIGPYSQAVQSGNLLFVSGQVAIDPSSNQVIDGDVKAEAEQVMKNLDQLLKAAGYSFSDIVKTSIFLSDMAHFTTVNEVYAAYFSSDFPARETVAVLGLPKNVNVEISIIAAKA